MIQLTDREFTVFTDYLRTNYGINLSKKRTLIEGRMNNYLVRKGFDDYTSYFDVLFKDKTGEEISQVINYLTTNYSYFMREWDHFIFYRDRALPEWKEKLKTKDLRVWSAASSTGEEPYTIAMVTDEFFGSERASWDKKILATDISERVLSHARQGIYDDASLEKVPANWKKNYFTHLANGNWQVKPYLQGEVIFRNFNLMEKNMPFRKRFHVIFCRNVMIYFDNETKRALVDRFYDVLEPGGYLIVGQSESVDRSVSKFKYIAPSIYCK